MPITLTPCHVSGTNVARVTDLEGEVLRVICPYLDEASQNCRIRMDAPAGGPLAELLENVAEHTLTNPGRRCELI